MQTVINELGGEKIDIIEWNESMEKYIANALSPAKIINVTIDESKRMALVIVPEDQISLAIGQRGQNVRLAAKLTGWKIDVKSERMIEEEKAKEAPTLVESEVGVPTVPVEASGTSSEENVGKDEKPKKSKRVKKTKNHDDKES